MKTLLQAGISGRGSVSTKKRFLFTLVGVIAFALSQSPSSSYGMVFDEQSLRDIAALEKKANEKVNKKDWKRLSKEARKALVKANEEAREEANLALSKYREKYLQWQTEKNVERAKQGKELYQEFLIPRGNAAYMNFEVKIEDLHAGVHVGGSVVNAGTMPYRYFVPDIGEEEKVPLILFIPSFDWQSGNSKDPWPPRHGTDNRYQFKDPEILAFVQPEFQEKYPCFLVAPQQINGSPWQGGNGPTIAMEKAVDIVDKLMARYPQIDPKRLYVTGPEAGGVGAFDAAAKYPNKFAAVVSMSGGKDPAHFKEKQKTTAWISYCEGESPGITNASNAIFDLFSSWGGDSRLVVYPGEGRRSWEYGYFDENLYEWLFEQSLWLKVSAADAARIQTLIEGLGAETWKERKAAYDELLAVGEKAAKFLEKASHSPDPEVALEARKLLDAL
jgi:predicted peptidase